MDLGFHVKQLERARQEPDQNKQLYAAWSMVRENYDYANMVSNTVSHRPQKLNSLTQGLHENVRNVTSHYIDAHQALTELFQKPVDSTVQLMANGVAEGLRWMHEETARRAYKHDCEAPKLVASDRARTLLGYLDNEARVHAQSIVRAAQVCEHYLKG